MDFLWMWRYLNSESRREAFNITIDWLKMGLLESVDDNPAASAAAAACLMVLVWIVFIIHQRKQSHSIKLPPGPRPLPIIGNLHTLGSLPHRKLRDLSQKYGPLMFMRLGCIPTIVVSSPDMAKAFLKTRDPLFASKPATAATKNMLYNSKDVGFAPYGPYWREMRKVCVFHLLSPKRIGSFQYVRAEEVSFMINSILQASHKGSIPVNVSKAASSLTSNIICRMTFGRKDAVEGLGGGGFKALVREFFRLLGAFNIGDFIPWLEWLDLQGLNRRQMKVHKTFDDFLAKIIQDHETQNSLEQDLVDVMLAISKDNDMEVEVTRDSIKAVILDMLVAGTETSSDVIEWGMSALLRNPSAMKKVQEELEKAIGLNRMVQECDLPRLEYLRSVVKETLRLYPPSPLLLRESIESCTVSSYEIPAESRVLVNIWAIGRDPKVWEDAEMFKPERFIENCIDVAGQNFELIPFGSGRRICAGMQLGIVVAEVALAQLLHCFNWRLPDGMNTQDLDMSEEFGLTMSRAVHLLSVPTPRLSIWRD